MNPHELATADLARRGREILSMEPATFYALPPAEKQEHLAVLGEWAARWRAQPGRPKVGPGSDHELELLDGVRADLRAAL